MFIIIMLYNFHTVCIHTHTLLYISTISQEWEKNKRRYCQMLTEVTTGWRDRLGMVFFPLFSKLPVIGLHIYFKNNLFQLVVQINAGTPLLHRPRKPQEHGNSRGQAAKQTGDPGPLAKDETTALPRNGQGMREEAGTRPRGSSPTTPTWLP